MERFPAWARDALETFRPASAFGKSEPGSEAVSRYNEFVTRITDRWPEINTGVLPSLRDLSDKQKRIVLEQALRCGYTYRESTLKDARAARPELKDLNSNIRRRAENLAKLLRRRRRIIEKGHAGDHEPDLFDMIERAASQYPDWESVLRPELQAFLRIARNQSRSGPNLEDVLDILDESCGPEIISERALDTRQTSPADCVRLVLENVALAKERKGGLIPNEFRLPNSALATLVGVVFDLPAGGITDDAVRKVRERYQPGVTRTTHPPKKS